MNTQIENSKPTNESADEGSNSFDYTYVRTIARIALYDDLRSAPRVTEIQPAPTAEFIESLASKIYEQAKMAGGAVPYTAIREVSENFIHARFAEIIVSILDDGNTIRFADQGPGIGQKDKAQLPGFTSAVEPMKHFIRGVGSGLPIVKEYLEFSHGTISIEDNLGAGSVVTISLKDKNNSQINEITPTNQSYGAYAAPYKQGSNNFHSPAAALVPPLSQRERDFLPIFLNEGALGVTDLARLTGVPQSSTYVTLSKLEEAGLIEKTAGQKRILTDLGFHVVNSL
ncbi:MAG: ATP-binding protein [Gordonibacter sp.]|nr:ATP-binding protein [Gordonibacter sp.]